MMRNVKLLTVARQVFKRFSESAASVKPTGPQADHREVANTLTIRALARDRFANIHLTWQSFALATTTHMYYHKASQKVFQSLGYQNSAAFLFQAEEVGVGAYLIARPNMSATECRQRLKPAVLYNLGAMGAEAGESFEGIPTVDCAPCDRGDLQQFGMLKMRSGPNLSLSRFFLLYGSMQDVTQREVDGLLKLMLFKPGNESIPKKLNL